MKQQLFPNLKIFDMTTLIASLILLLAMEASSRWLPKRYTQRYEGWILKVKTLLKRWKFAFELAEKAVSAVKLLRLAARLIISILPFVLNWFQ